MQSTLPVTIFCLPEKMNAEARVKSELAEGRQRRPNLKLQGGVIKSLKWNKKCVPETSLKRTVLVGEPDVTQRRLIGTFKGGWAGGPPPGVSPWLLRGPLASPGSAATFLLYLRQAVSALRCSPPLPSLFPGFSRLLLAHGWTLGITRPSLQPVSCHHAPSLLESWANGVPGVHYWELSLLAVFLHSWWWDAQGNWRHFWISPECGCYMNLVAYSRIMWFYWRFLYSY